MSCLRDNVWLHFTPGLLSLVARKFFEGFFPDFRVSNGFLVQNCIEKIGFPGF